MPDGEEQESPWRSAGDDPEGALPRGAPPSPAPAPGPEEVFRGAMQHPPVPPGWRAPSPEELDALLPDFTVVRMLGRGGMGAVYEAIQKALDRSVAIKILPPELSRDLEFETRFRREARAMALLNHPNIIQIHDSGQTEGGYFYFVMEFVDGSDLHRIIGDAGIDQGKALEIVIGICRALQYAHGKGYVHRDVKPSNILLTEDGFVKIGDFGLARLIDVEKGSETERQRLSLTGSSMGTPNYMAPEQLDGKDEIDHRADIFSLGVTFYEMLTGEIPRGAFTPPSEKVALDARIDDVVIKAMQQSPGRRYQSASELEADLETIRTHPRGRTMALREKRATKAGGKGWTTAAVSLFLVGLFAAAWLWQPWRKRDSSPEERPETEAAVSDSPGPVLPPALAEIRLRGGRLRAWAAPGSENDVLPLEAAEGFDDLIDVEVGPDAWFARRADGTLVGHDLSPHLKEVSGIVKIDGNGMALTGNGRLHRNPALFPGSDPSLEGVRDFAVGGGFGVFLRGNGKVFFQSVGGRRESLEERSRLADIWVPGLYWERNNVAVFLEDGPFVGVLRSDGHLLTGGLHGTVNQYQLKNPVAVELTPSGAFLALLRDGRIVAAPSLEKSIPKDIGEAYAIRHANRIGAAQLRDGTWRAWGDGDPGVIDRINGLGPAVDISFDAMGSLYWIEPAKIGGKPESSGPSRSIELPPTLSGMKQRGGRLRVWSSPGAQHPIAPADPAAAIDDLVAVTSGGREWLGLRRNGSVISSFEKSDHLRDITDAIQISAGRSHTALRANGILAAGSRHLAGVEFPEGIEDFEFSYGLAIFLLQSGEVVFRLLPQGDEAAVLRLREMTERWEKVINSRKDNIAVQIDNSPTCAVLRKDGTLLVGTPDGSIFDPAERDARIRQIVDADVTGAGQLIALRKDGRVVGSPWLEIPSDLGKAVAVRTKPGISAAQMEDGSWVAWGKRTDLVEKINSLGPAVDLSFAPESGNLVWIEPAK